ncbi:response regulator receiver modulated diguanylate cyclase [Thiorhodococcus drewsii AZ1]|uniref:diguanylate cyclase n=1 Tax=Thiorhodococcus drewsii AZ1 TaxID=765913 RepID=G2DZ00_9GAMM|nr:diguanylate cyclase [Thiorhodococcus drewsii]EGV32354.1 response regulator receiver modulated diguanylate cyclase [Thiorhodococcus drewsii AZ1]
MPEQRRILIVDDDARNIKVAANALNDTGVVIGFAKSGEEALNRLRETPFDLILLDVMMPRLDGFQVCSRLKEDPRTAGIPVIFLTARTDEESIERAYEVGGIDYVSKPFRTRELAARVRVQLRQLDLIERLEFLATRDSLTGVFNRRRFFELGSVMLAEFRGELVAMMIDVDHFKRINDAYGHQVGDAVLRQIASTIETTLPQGALFGRLGGEEFALLVRVRDAEEAMVYADRLRECVASIDLAQVEGSGLRCTISIGLSVAEGDVSLDAVLNEADRMLYRAKDEGRNRAVLRG